MRHNGLFQPKTVNRLILKHKLLRPCFIIILGLNKLLKYLIIYSVSKMSRQYIFS